MRKKSIFFSVVAPTLEICNFAIRSEYGFRTSINFFRVNVIILHLTKNNLPVDITPNRQPKFARLSRVWVGRPLCREFSTRFGASKRRPWTGHPFAQARVYINNVVLESYACVIIFYRYNTRRRRRVYNSSTCILYIMYLPVVLLQVGTRVISVTPPGPSCHGNCY